MWVLAATKCDCESGQLWTIGQLQLKVNLSTPQLIFHIKLCVKEATYSKYNPELCRIWSTWLIVQIVEIFVLGNIVTGDQRIARSGSHSQVEILDGFEWATEQLSLAKCVRKGLWANLFKTPVFSFHFRKLLSKFYIRCSFSIPRFFSVLKFKLREFQRVLNWIRECVLQQFQWLDNTPLRAILKFS